ncbi:hypothetical protein FRC09_011169 [Ceratobasidium sp. 395]|nr:hypothetical protein FRC09_011169 [Ceratobasidium sp. 395]
MTSTNPSSPSLSSQLAAASQTTSAESSASGTALVHMVDRITQQLGLSSDDRQQLYMFAFQDLSNRELLWVFAGLLRSYHATEALSQRIESFNTQLDVIVNLIRQNFKLGNTTATMIKKLIRMLLATSKVNLDSVEDKAKRYIHEHSSQFSLDLYVTDDTVKGIVNSSIKTMCHQARGSMRKAIFNEVIGGRPIVDATTRVCFALGTEVGSPPPKYIQAHVAQLRVIAHKRMTAIHAMEQYMASHNPTPNTSGRRPRSDTGFWSAVTATFKGLVNLYTAAYDENDGWRNWEESIIEQDAVLFFGGSQFTGHGHDWEDLDD